MVQLTGSGQGKRHARMRGRMEDRWILAYRYLRSAPGCSILLNGGSGWLNSAQPAQSACAMSACVTRRPAIQRCRGGHHRVAARGPGGDWDACPGGLAASPVVVAALQDLDDRRARETAHREKARLFGALGRRFGKLAVLLAPHGLRAGE